MSVDEIEAVGRDAAGKPAADEASRRKANLAALRNRAAGLMYRLLPGTRREVEAVLDAIVELVLAVADDRRATADDENERFLDDVTNSIDRT